VGRLRAPDRDREIELPTRCLVGRAPACDLVLDGKTVSGHHAVIEWSGTSWELQDLGSRNGTYLDERKVTGGGRSALVRGMRLGFGRAAETWILTDAAAPQLMARNLSTDEYRVAEGGYLALPAGASPEYCVYQDPHGSWVAERRGEPEAVSDQHVVTLGTGAVWRIYLPTTIAGTLKDQDGAVLLVHLCLRFSVSLDEEHVALVATCGEQTWDLQSRAHHYPLLVLARQRIADLRAGLPASEQGWIRQDELSKMLRMDDNHINISIHRARAQLGKLGVVDAASLVERRAGSRQVRIGLGQLEVVVPGATPQP